MAETSIVQRLRGFRDGLLVLKEDRTTYIRSADVLVNYQTLCELHEAVESQFGALDSGSEKSSEQLDVERLLEDCFLLISLLFLTVGKNLDPPATYAPCVVIKRLLDHLTESSNFSNKDIAPVHNSLRGFREAIQNNGSTHDLRVNLRMAAKVEECEAVLRNLKGELNLISPTLYSVHERLVSLRRCIKAAEAKKKFPESEIKGYLGQIKQIDATKVDGKFAGDDGAIPENGQEQVQTVMDRCYATAEEALHRQGAIAPALLHYADTLHKLKHKLEKLELTQAWSLRETDLYEFMVKLMHYDDARVDGKFVAEDGSSPEEGQGTILYLLRRSYAHIYTLLIHSEPVSEALTPIFNQLQTVQRCLKEVQKFGIADPRDLYPYSMKLSSIENMKVDGKFMAGNDIPEGQGRVASLLAECFEICQELRMNTPDKSPAL